MADCSGEHPKKHPLFLPPDTCPHGYNLTTRDMKKLMRANILLINGADLEIFLKQITNHLNKDLTIVDTSQGIKLIPNVSYTSNSWNPHIWVSPLCAIKQVRNIAKALSNYDPKNRHMYMKNADFYCSILEKLFEKFKNTIKQAKNRKIVESHNMMDYFARDVGLKIIGIIRINPIIAPSPKHLNNLIKQIRNQKPFGIFTEPQYPSRIAKMLMEESKVPIYPFDPVISGNYNANLYETVMEKNLQTLKKALNFNSKSGAPK